jgi:hypothetical protein
MNDATERVIISLEDSDEENVFIVKIAMIKKIAQIPASQ